MPVIGNSTYTETPILYFEFYLHSNSYFKKIKEYIS